MIQVNVNNAYAATVSDVYELADCIVDETLPGDEVMIVVDNTGIGRYRMEPHDHIVLVSEEGAAQGIYNDLRDCALLITD